MSATATETAAPLRRQILDTARHLLVSEGYPSLSMRRIAQAIGYSATSIYLHFANKDALFHALIDEGFARLYEILVAASQSADEPTERLAALAHGYVAFGLANPELYEIMFLLHPAHMARYPAENYRRARLGLDLFGATLADGVKSGAFVEMPLRPATAVVWSALHGAVSLVLANRLDSRIEREPFFDAVVAGALAPLVAGR